MSKSFELESRILQSLKKREGIATAADVSADTGIGLGETENELRRMLSWYKSHLDVDDDGNLLYRFDPELVRRGEDRDHTWYMLKKQITAALRLLFKVWVMIMLVGYTIVFIVILLALAVGALTQSNDRDNGLAMLPLRLLGSLLEWVFWWNVFDDRRSSSSRRSGYGNQSFGGFETRGYAAKRLKHKVDKPLYQKITDWVVGPENPKDPLKAQQRFAAWARNNKGIVTPADWSIRTGLSLEDSENALTAGIMRFGGDVQVTENGVLLYRFDELRLKATEDAAESVNMRGDLPVVWQDKAKPQPFSGNAASTDFWIALFTMFNLFMSSATLVTYNAGTIPEMTAGVAIALGWIPLVFSAAMLGIPVIRWFLRIAERARAARESKRRKALRTVFESVRGGRAEAVMLDPEFEKEFALEFNGEPVEAQNGRMLWRFDELALHFQEATDARNAAHSQIVFGQTVFSSDESTKSMNDADLEDFERRLAMELGIPETQYA